MMFKGSPEKREKDRIRQQRRRERLQRTTGEGARRRIIIESDEGKRQVTINDRVRTYTNPCPICEKEYRTRRVDQKYCSSVCRDWANKGFKKYDDLKCFDERTSTIIDRRHGKLPNLFDFRPNKAPKEMDRRKRLKQLLHSIERRNFFANRSSADIKPSEFRSKAYVHYLMDNWCTEEERQTLYRKYLPADQRRPLK